MCCCGGLVSASQQLETHRKLISNEISYLQSSFLCIHCSFSTRFDKRAVLRVRKSDFFEKISELRMVDLILFARNSFPELTTFLVEIVESLSVRFQKIFFLNENFGFVHSFHLRRSFRCNCPSECSFSERKS